MRLLQHEDVERGQPARPAGSADGLLELVYRVIREAVRDGVADALRAGSAAQEGARGKYVTPREAAERLRVHPQTVYELVKQGKIRSARVGRRILIPETAISELPAALLQR